MDDKFARRVAQGAGLLVEGFTQPLQCQNAQCVLGHSHKTFWTLLRGKPCNPDNSQIWLPQLEKDNMCIYAPLFACVYGCTKQQQLAIPH